MVYIMDGMKDENGRLEGRLAESRRQLGEISSVVVAGWVKGQGMQKRRGTGSYGSKVVLGRW